MPDGSSDAPDGSLGMPDDSSDVPDGSSDVPDDPSDVPDELGGVPDLPVLLSFPVDTQPSCTIAEGGTESVRRWAVTSSTCARSASQSWAATLSLILLPVTRQPPNCW
jgi:hypothetical protein